MEKYLSQLIWDDENLSTCSCRLRAEDYDKFKTLCYSQGETPHSIIRLLVASYMLSFKVVPSKQLVNDMFQNKMIRRIRINKK